MTDWFAPFATQYPLRWQMTPAERLALIGLTTHLRPTCAIEIGTSRGGSLQVLASLSQKVYALDIDPDVRQHVPAFPNVDFRIGNSRETLPRVFAELETARTPCDLILVDGAHDAAGVRADLNTILQHRPLQTTFVLMHDSFNPTCRAGILSADWHRCPYTQSVDIDFVQGWFHTAQYDGEDMDGQMWGGFALAILTHAARCGDLIVTEKQRPTFDQMRLHSSHVTPPLGTRIRQAVSRRIRRMLTGFRLH